MKSEEKRVAWALGIVNKQMIQSPQRPDLWIMASCAKESLTGHYVEHNGVLFEVGMNPASIDNPIDHDLLEQRIKHVNKMQVTDGNPFVRISLGIAEYLGKLEEAKKQKEANSAKQLAVLAEEEAKRVGSKVALAVAFEEDMDKAEMLLLADGNILPDLFLGLCKRHGVSIPLRTHGWAKSNLQSIAQRRYTHYASPSTKIMEVMRALMGSINEKHPVAAEPEALRS